MAHWSIYLKGVSNKINRAYIVGNGTVLNQQVLCKVYWNKYPGITYIEVPKQTIDKYYTVIALVLDDTIDLYKEKVGAIENN